jgi:hypothetical protein
MEEADIGSCKHVLRIIVKHLVHQDFAQRNSRVIRAQINGFHCH